MQPKVETGVPLAGLTTLAVGGAARFLAQAPDAAALYDCIQFARRETVPWMVLGGGSNVVVADSGFPGLVVRITDRTCRIEQDADSALVTAGAGLDWDGFVARMVAEGLAGIECLSGIPGRVGAVPIQNVGAYGQEVSQTIEAVEVLDVDSGKVVCVAGGDCGFANRTSRFKTAWKDRYVVLRIAFRLSRHGPAPARYDELRRRLQKEAGPAPSLGEIRRTVIAIRREKSMVLDPADENRRSVGSFFVNPIVGAAQFAEVQQRAAALAPNERMPAFDAGPDRIKLSAAWLIERAGFRRGDGEGRVGLSTRHTLAIVNRGGARAADVVAFAGRVRRGVFAAWGVRLDPEPVFVGFDRPVAALLGP